jgi:hypothetical protein
VALVPWLAVCGEAGEGEAGEGEAGEGANVGHACLHAAMHSVQCINVLVLLVQALCTAVQMLWMCSLPGKGFTTSSKVSCQVHQDCLVDNIHTIWHRCLTCILRLQVRALARLVTAI